MHTNMPSFSGGITGNINYMNSRDLNYQSFMPRLIGT